MGIILRIIKLIDLTKHKDNLQKKEQKKEKVLVKNQMLETKEAKYKRITYKLKSKHKRISSAINNTSTFSCKQPRTGSLMQMLISITEVIITSKQF